MLRVDLHLSLSVCMYVYSDIIHLCPFFLYTVCMDEASVLVYVQRPRGVRMRIASNTSLSSISLSSFFHVPKTFSLSSVSLRRPSLLSACAECGHKYALHSSVHLSIYAEEDEEETRGGATSLSMRLLRVLFLLLSPSFLSSLHSHPPRSLSVLSLIHFALSFFLRLLFLSFFS